MCASPGDILGIDIGEGVFCYLRVYRFGKGVLPFLSRGPVEQVSALPTLTPRFFIQTWVYNSDPTPIFVVGHVPFASDEESWGQPMYYPPDPIEPCFKIHGVFNGVFSIIASVSRKTKANMKQINRTL